jgi:hypothetical protein
MVIGFLVPVHVLKHFTGSRSKIVTFFIGIFNNKSNKLKLRKACKTHHKNKGNSFASKPYFTHKLSADSQ